jgi:serine/threonine protein kinase/Tfp pilus assembly protein PilF
MISKLGEGGMGEVYLAEDSRLGRQVALKFLPASFQYDPVRRERFLREARAASALRSANIAAIYDIGEHEGAIFIAMEYVEGETLSQRLHRTPFPAREAADIAAQIADALDEAHALGIIHRDIKSSNIIVTGRGLVKVLDFGLAKVVQPPGSDAESYRTTALDDEKSRDDRTEPTVDLGGSTTAGLVVGTVPYMSPEQALGNVVDHRSDLFSLGVVIYEMLTGRLPFEGGSTTQLIDKIVHQEPVAIARLNYNVPVELERIVRKCLDKDSGGRYQSARELLIDLRILSRDNSGASALTSALNVVAEPPRKTRSRKAINSLAILPLANDGNDPDAEYLSDGITESIIKNLSQLSKLRVMARSTVFRYKGRTVDAQTAGVELGVRAVLTGRVLLRGDALIIKTELVDTQDGSQLWGEHYNRKLSDIFAVEEEISREISEKLRLKLSREQKKKLTRRYTDNTEAYQTYLKGRFYWNKRTEDGLRRGIEYFQQAIDLDPGYALAYAGLADSYNLLAGYSALSPREAFPRAKAAARKALEIDDTLAEAHTSLAFVMLAYDWDWEGAERTFKRAISLDPAYATAHHWYALFLIAMSRTIEGIDEIKRAQELEPLSLAISTSLGFVCHLNRDFDQAIEAYGKTLEMEPAFTLARRRLGQTYLAKGKFKQAVAEIEKAAAASPDTETLAALGQAYAVSGNRAEATRLLDQLAALSSHKYIPSFFLARIYVGLGEKDLALEYFEKAYDERYGMLAYLKLEPAFDSLQSDPRFQALMERVGIA